MIIIIIIIIIFIIIIIILGTNLRRKYNNDAAQQGRTESLQWPGSRYTVHGKEKKNERFSMIPCGPPHWLIVSFLTIPPMAGDEAIYLVFLLTLAFSLSFLGITLLERCVVYLYHIKYSLL